MSKNNGPVSVYAVCPHQKPLIGGCGKCGRIGQKAITVADMLKPKSEIDMIWERISKIEQRMTDWEDRQDPGKYNDY